MEKLITFTVPCYNSAKFMHHCIESLLVAGDDAEIILINDGSKDNTGEIADSFAREYPNIVRVIHQENGGHGEGINQGLRNARGKYFKVVDSDDRLDSDVLVRFLDEVRKNEAAGCDVDMYVCNYVYVRIDTGDRRPMSYKRNFPEKKICSWDDVKSFGPSKYLMMHSVTYRTQLLRDCKFSLPKHTFYVDNLYMYVPFPSVKRIFYMNEDMYLYFVGSDEQSVNEKNVLKRIDQQILVTKLVMDSHDLNEIKKQSRKLYRYMLHELSILISICDVFLSIKGDRESVGKIKELWKYLKEKDRKTYRKMRYFALCAFTKVPGRLGRKILIGVYRIVNKIYKPN